MYIGSLRMNKQTMKWNLLLASISVWSCQGHIIVYHACGIEPEHSEKPLHSEPTER